MRQTLSPHPERRAQTQEAGERGADRDDAPSLAPQRHRVARQHGEWGRDRRLADREPEDSHSERRGQPQRARAALSIERARAESQAGERCGQPGRVRHEGCGEPGEDRCGGEHGGPEQRERLGHEPAEQHVCGPERDHAGDGAGPVRRRDRGAQDRQERQAPDQMPHEGHRAEADEMDAARVQQRRVDSVIGPVVDARYAERASRERHDERNADTGRDHPGRGETAPKVGREGPGQPQRRGPGPVTRDFDPVGHSSASSGPLPAHPKATGGATQTFVANAHVSLAR